MITDDYMNNKGIEIMNERENLNRFDCDVLLTLQKKHYDNQRSLAMATSHSLGVINQSVRNLVAEGLITEDMSLTDSALELIEANSPKRAIILAAGYGMRMVPFNSEISKGLIKVYGEVLIERTIKQLKSVGITEIYVVVGFMKEQYEYLIDEFGVKLIVNSEYGTKNNLHSLKRAMDHLDNAYIIPCDIRIDFNPYNQCEMYSWYMISDKIDENSSVRINRKNELVRIHDESEGNAMIGISYLTESDAQIVRDKLSEYVVKKSYDEAFWEETLFDKDRMRINARVIDQDCAIEINTYEQLREIDSDVNHLKSDSLDTISHVLNISPEEIVNIEIPKKGMTNRSFLFTARDRRYMMRIPGEGTDKLINRKQEMEVYQALDGKNICDPIIYINSDNGYKISEYLEGARNCDPNNYDEVLLCMKQLRRFHEKKLSVAHVFDIYGQIEFYETLWEGKESVFRDYKETKANVLSLRNYVNEHAKTYVLTHIDAVPDNFLFVPSGSGEEIKLIDWEYSGMQDPDVDIAMFCIYSMYDREQVDKLIDAYYTEGCSIAVRMKIYCYIATCGLLWSNWCEYKRNLGVEFGEYALRQYRFAKDYYRRVKKYLEETR